MYDEVIEVGYHPTGMVSLQEEEMRTRMCTEESPGKTGEDSHPQAKERSLRRNQP